MGGETLTDTSMIPIVPDHAARLRAEVDRAVPALLALTDEASAARPAPGKWSPREIIGHLVDSASNNHQRFVRAQLQDDMVFPGYEQDAWVSTQHYQETAWRELVAFWAQFNRHLAHVIDAMPPGVLTRRRERHNLHERAFKPVPPTEPATLEYFVGDYVDHLRHHLRQIFGPSWGAV
jgi:hypothetical protein